MEIYTPKKLVLTLCALAMCCTQFIGAIPQKIEEKQQAMKSFSVYLNENQKATKPYYIGYHDRKFLVYPNVFSPKVFPDTLFFADNIQIKPGESFLEIGSGTGLIAVTAALRGASHVVAVDITTNAVNNTTQNAFLHHVNKIVKIFEGDVFDPVPRGQQFDLIFWNTPFMHIEKENLTDLEKALYDPQYRSLTRYLKEGKTFLTPKGKMLVGFSSTHSHMEILEELAQEHGWQLRIIAENVESIPKLPGVDGADTIDALLIELVPQRP